jgi:hypothetical protein
VTNVAVPQEPDLGGENDMFFQVLGSGPFFWTSSRNNGGDLGANISPFYGPMDSRSYPTQPADNWAEQQGGTTYAWRLSYATGVSFATPRVNGISGRFTYNGTPITLYITAGVGNQSSAHGYSMYTGLHTVPNGAGAQAYGVDVLMGCAGIPDRMEAVGSIATAYFPFEQGWVGGSWNNLTGGWQDGWSSPDLPTSVVTVNPNSSYFVSLPGVNSATDGMIFVNSSQTENRLKLIGAYPNNGGWTIFLRDNDDIDLTGQTPAPDPVDRRNFSFIYVPYTATRLIGGRINGSTGAVLQQGLAAFSISRIEAGRYSLSIAGKNDANGGLVINPTGLMFGSGDLPDRTFFSYEYDSVNNRFIIESREIIPDNNTPWQRTPTLRDSDFDFVWIDYARPLAPGICVGDLDGDGQIGLPDLAILLSNYGASSGATLADGNIEGGDEDVDLNDLTLLLSTYGVICP